MVGCLILICLDITCSCSAQQACAQETACFASPPFFYCSLARAQAGLGGHRGPQPWISCRALPRRGLTQQPQQGASRHPGSSGLQSQICWVATLLQAASTSASTSARLRQTCWAGPGQHQPAVLLPVQQICWVGLRQPPQSRVPLPAPSRLPESLRRGMQQL